MHVFCQDLEHSLEEASLHNLTDRDHLALRVFAHAGSSQLLVATLFEYDGT